MGNQENGYIILLFLGLNNFCWAGFQVESELEWESIFSNGSRSRLKFVDSAALLVAKRTRKIYSKALMNTLGLFGIFRSLHQ